MSLNCNYLQLDMLQLSEVTVGRSYSCLWLQLAEVTVVCGYSLQKLQLTFYTRFQNGPRALTWGQLFWSNATCRRIWTKYLPQWRCLTCPQCLWSSERGSSREQAVPAGNSPLRVSSTAFVGFEGRMEPLFQLWSLWNMLCPCIGLVIDKILDKNWFVEIGFVQEACWTCRAIFSCNQCFGYPQKILLQICCVKTLPDLTREEGHIR